MESSSSVIIQCVNADKRVLSSRLLRISACKGVYNQDESRDEKVKQVLSISRRKFLGLSFGATVGISLAGAGSVVYSTHIEPYQIDITRRTFRLDNLPPAFDGFTMTQISDLHMGEWMTLERMQSIVEQVNTLDADLVVITGDYVTAIHRQTPGEITAALRQLRAREGVIGILGNHDHWTNARTIRRAVQGSGALLLLNEHTRIQRGGDTLVIAGVDDVAERQHDLRAALRGLDRQSCIILLAHEPDYADRVAADGRVALQLSGHSHGGQVHLPVIGSPVLPYLGRKYYLGAYTIENLQLYVNRGLGMVRPFVRFGCPPEITHITLQGAAI